MQQCLAAGYIDELQIDMAPLKLGGGQRFFDQQHPRQLELQQISVLAGGGVTHVAYRVMYLSREEPILQKD